MHLLHKLGDWMDKRLQIFLLLPAAVIMFMVFVYPILYNFFLSFMNSGITTMKNPEFAGFQNYVRLLKDIEFYKSLSRTFIFVAVGVSLQFVFGFLLALAMNKLEKGRNIMTTLLVFPMMITPVVVGLMWKFILDFNSGIFNYLISLFGIPKAALLSGQTSALPTLILIDVWQAVGFMFVILLAGMKSLPAEPYEAAVIDGASHWQTISKITLPLLRPVVIVALMMRIASSIKIFDQIFVLTGGGPGSATETFSILLNRKSFLEFDFGYSSTLAIAITIIVGIVCWYSVRALYSEKD